MHHYQLFSFDKYTMVFDKMSTVREIERRVYGTGAIFVTFL